MAVRDAAPSAASGAALFARYAYPPNELGHCGPPGAEVLLEGATSGDDDGELRRRAALFDGAWPYLRLIAAAADTPDPLDPQVVQAYWLGGPLLDAVDPQTFVDTAQTSFGTQPGVPERVAQLAGMSTWASHAYHVFVVYPWVGLLGGTADVPRSVLDSCRVRWGQVVEVRDESAVVRSLPLVWDGAALSLGPEQTEHPRWTSHGRAFVSGLEVGDTVSLHWDWVCDRLEPDQVEWLRTGTLRQLEATNRWLAARTS
jgi:hypothetical protein